MTRPRDNLSPKNTCKFYYSAFQKVIILRDLQKVFSMLNIDLLTTLYAET